MRSLINQSMKKKEKEKQKMKQKKENIEAKQDNKKQRTRVIH